MALAAMMTITTATSSSIRKSSPIRAIMLYSCVSARRFADFLNMSSSYNNFHRIKSPYCLLSVQLQQGWVCYGRSMHAVIWPKGTIFMYIASFTDIFVLGTQRDQSGNPRNQIGSRDPRSQLLVWVLQKYLVPTESNTEPRDSRSQIFGS